MKNLFTTNRCSLQINSINIRQSLLEIQFGENEGWRRSILRSGKYFQQSELFVAIISFLG